MEPLNGLMVGNILDSGTKGSSMELASTLQAKGRNGMENGIMARGSDRNIIDLSVPFILSLLLINIKSMAKRTYSRRVELEEDDGIPDPVPEDPRLPKTQEEKQTFPRLIVILEDANLETMLSKRGIELVNCDDH
jgi:hypothetical protein